MQARGQMSKGERAPHQHPIHFFSKVGINFMLFCHKHRFSSFQFHLEMYLSFLLFSPFSRLITFVRWVATGNPSAQKPLCLCNVTILEIHVGVPIAITTLIKASHIVLPEEQYFSLTAPHSSQTHSSRTMNGHASDLYSPHLPLKYTL